MQTMTGEKNKMVPAGKNTRCGSVSGVVGHVGNVLQAVAFCPRGFQVPDRGFGILWCGEILPMDRHRPAALPCGQ